MKKVITYIIVTIFIMAILFGSIDFVRIKNFSMPYFCIKLKQDYGMNGKYIGLGYSIGIYSEYNKTKQLFDITEFQYKILGIEVLTGINK